MTTHNAVKRYFRRCRRHPDRTSAVAPSSVAIPDIRPKVPARRVTPPRRLTNEERQALAWLDQTVTDDPILLNIRRLVTSNEQLLPFHLRVVRRAHHEMLSSIDYYSRTPAKRRDDRLARQQAEVIARRVANSERPDQELILGIQARASVGIEPTDDELLLLENAQHLDLDSDDD